jgi:hypothetical protein
MKHRFAKLIEEALLNQKNDVDNSFPSIFSREDVKHQLEEFGYGLITTILEMTEEQKPSTSISLHGVEELSKLLCEAINSKIDRLDANEVVDFDSASFAINYNNCVELEEIDFESSNITNEVENAVDEVLRDFFTPEEEEVKEETETPYATYQ